MASAVNFRVWFHFPIIAKYKPRFRVVADQRLSSNGDIQVLTSDGVKVSRVSGAVIEESKRKGYPFLDSENGKLKRVEKKKEIVSDELQVLWDDGYGSNTVKDYLDAAKDMIKADGGPPRWFCPVECGCPVKGSPVLLYLPGLDGVGMGLMLHHKALGKAFEVQCLHIPVNDRTPFEGLVKLVEETVKFQNASRPNSPIYLVGESFGGCLALAIAARNPNIDLVVILGNPATSFGSSQLQPILPILEAIPAELHVTIPYLLGLVIGEPVKMAAVGIEGKLPPAKRIEQLSGNLTALLPRLLGLTNIITKGTLSWKLKLLKSATAYANSRLHAVKAEVLVLASGKDNMFPSREEAQRLKKLLPNCEVRCFKENGHTIFLEDSMNLLTVIKGTCKYRRSKRHDFISDFLPPSVSEYRKAFEEIHGLLEFATCSAMYSTMADGKIVEGLAGIPNEGPVIFIGYHMLMGLELTSFIEAFLREKKIVVHGVAHPELFWGKARSPKEFSFSDWIKVFGAFPVSSKYLFKALSKKSHILLYPGGEREALHNKGEQYKLFWPNQPEFVRMAARFGATIVPFGTVGEDDIAELVLDYHDLSKIPMFSNFIKELRKDAIKIRDESKGEVANRDIFVPVMLPKIPGRFYYLFGKPINLKVREDLLVSKEAANEIYFHVKSEVEQCIDYLLKKREEDPYRSIIDRTVYRALQAPLHQVPAFKP